jgi:hypothetical protein
MEEELKTGTAIQLVYVLQRVQKYFYSENDELPLTLMITSLLMKRVGITWIKEKKMDEGDCISKMRMELCR